MRRASCSRSRVWRTRQIACCRWLKHNHQPSHAPLRAGTTTATHADAVCLAELKNFINAEFMTMDVDRSAGVEENEFAAWYVRFHDWIAEHRELRDAGIDVHAVDVIMPEGAGEELLTTVVRYCKEMHGLKVRRFGAPATSASTLSPLRRAPTPRDTRSAPGGGGASQRAR